MIQFCCDELRRAALRDGPINGIDFVEVVDRDAPSPDMRQRILHLHLVNDPGATVFTTDNVEIVGGERIRGIAVTDVQMGLGPQTNVVVVEVDRPGDFTTYTIRLVRGPLDPRPPEGFDPVLSVIDFGFKAECPTDFDCAPPCDCPDERLAPPQIDYLAKDFAALRQVMFDRMAQLAPDWTERNAADPMVTLVELLAWVGDQVSYAQDAAHNEALLNRCASRISLRRIVRLVDDRVSEGANARVHVHLRVSADVVPLPAAPPAVPRGAAIATLLDGEGVTVAANPQLLARAHAVYETMHEVRALRVLHNEMSFYTWSDQRCCLPRGTVRASLAGHFPDLAPGETLIFEEVVGPRTGRRADADPAHRQAVRLIAIQAFGDDGDPLTDPVTGDDVTWIDWHEEDALRFPLCLSAETDPEFGAAFLPAVSVARGNVVLADHGLTQPEEDLGAVPDPAYRFAAPQGCDPCDRPAPAVAPPRFAPQLAGRPVTHAVPFDPDASATAVLAQEPAEAVPQVWLDSAPDGAEWEARIDLLSSGPFADEFVVETETDGRAQIRFGDDVNGRRPEPGTGFVARYRVGSGRAGAVGTEALRHIALPIPEIVAVRNPLPATGGVDPESVEAVRQRAPFAFRRQERCVTRADYSEVTERLADVQRAEGSWFHSGSWLTVTVAADRFGGGAVEPGFAEMVRAYLERFRLAGYDLRVDDPIFVPLELALFVCVRAGHFRSHVRRRLVALLGADRAPDGSPGLFHPDRLSFGQTVWLSPVIAAVQGVEGVESVRATTFRRLGDQGSGGLEDERLDFERLEIARLDNDPNYPERGVLTLTLAGGL